MSCYSGRELFDLLIFPIQHGRLIIPTLIDFRSFPVSEEIVSNDERSSFNSLFSFSYKK